MVLYGKRSDFVRFLVGDVRIRVRIRSGFVRFLSFMLFRFVTMGVAYVRVLFGHVVIVMV